MNIMNTQNETIGKKLKTYRLSNLWTLQQMADKCGLSTGTIQRIESDAVDPHDLSIAKLLRAFPDLDIDSAV